VHVEQELLEVEEVPGRFRGVGGDGGVGLIEEDGVDQDREDGEGAEEEDGGDELDEDQIRPDEQLLLADAALPGTNGP
jgi:hypothetical protein